MQEKLSIIIPVYNGEKYIEKCLDSICAGTYKNLEIIVVDDHSTDRSVEIVGKFTEAVSLNKTETEGQDKAGTAGRGKTETAGQSAVEEDGQINCEILLVSNRGRGVSAARNTGIDAATGRYITFVDADDYIDGNAYEAVIGMMETAGSGAGIYAITRETDGNKILEPLPWPNGKVLGRKEIVTELIPLTLEARRGETWVSGSVWRLVFRRSCLKARFDEDTVYREDQLFCLSAYCDLKDIVVCNDASYHYVKHGITTTERYRKNFLSESMDCERKITEVLKSKGIFEKVLDHYKIQRLSAYSLCISNLYRFDAEGDHSEELNEVMAAFALDEICRFSPGEVIKLRTKHAVPYVLMRMAHAGLIEAVYKRKEKRRQDSLTD